MRVIKDRILLTPIKERQVGAIIKPLNGDEPKRGKVLETGSEVVGISKGDVVIHGAFAGTEISEDGIDYLIIKEAEVLAII